MSITNRAIRPDEVDDEKSKTFPDADLKRSMN
jgi:hypothetical protein